MQKPNWLLLYCLSQSDRRRQIEIETMQDKKWKRERALAGCALCCCPGTCDDSEQLKLHLWCFQAETNCRQAACRHVVVCVCQCVCTYSSWLQPHGLQPFRMSSACCVCVCLYSMWLAATCVSCMCACVIVVVCENSWIQFTANLHNVIVNLLSRWIRLQFANEL